MGLSQVLTSAGQTRWLDVGCGADFSPGFEYLDVLPVGAVPEELRDRYHRADIANLTDHAVGDLGQFDLVRMQHTLEHFGFEDGLRVLQNCADLLRPGGLILISVPDLLRHIRTYLKDDYVNMPGFKEWAQARIPADAPPSAYFSVFTHSLTYEPHKWCYDFAGLAHQLGRSHRFTEISRLERTDPLAEVPFTHNRPEEDLCVLARRS
ncbi:methyltransferase domain-containing protein [Kribbella sp. NPDC050124]|uniref:methyltransferase domain-containing protein n=1 Tax=Kribbella sp. NPDC050124 TaxID=3364114 RepID=UPI0037957888